MKAQYFFKVLGITIFSLFLLNSLGMAQIHYDSSGNVGIGTTSPTEKLEVSGTVKATSFVGDGSQLTGINGSGLWTEGTKGIYYNNGNVSIGTTNPWSRFHVVGNILAQYGYIRTHNGNDYASMEADDANNLSEIRWGDDTNDRFRFYFDYWIGTDSDKEVMSLLSNGNVGIGTTSPAYKLHVDGDIYATGSIYGASGTADTDWIENGGNVYRESGNVGIGTSEPEFPLHIAGTTAQIGSGNLARLRLKPGSAGIAQIQVCTMNRPFRLSKYDGTHMLTVDTSNGNVGIGTTEPPRPLHVVGNPANACNTAAFIRGDNNYGVAIGGLLGKEYGDIQAARFGSDGKGEDVNVPLVLQGNGGNVGIGMTTPESKLEVAGNIDADSFTINGVPLGTSSDTYWSENSGNIYYNSGNVGIGTMSPDDNLHVVNNISVGGTSDGDGDITLKDESGNQKIQLDAAGATAGSGSTTVYLSGAGDSYITSGNIGIGTTSPSRRLDVAGNVIANAYEHHSDSQLKKNIASIDNALDKVLALRGVEFEWRIEEYPEKGFVEGRKIGLIAQEVEQVIPEVVSIDNEGYRSVEYGKIVSVLIEAIKAQQAQIEELKARIEVLEQ